METLLKFVLEDTSKTSAFILGVIVVLMVLERATHYLFEWHKSKGDKEMRDHMHNMAESVRELGYGVKETERKVENLEQEVKAIKRDTTVLIDRRYPV